MPLYEKHIQPFYTLLDTCFSVVRILSQSKFRKTSPMTREHDKCLILGNGPSLINTLENNKDRFNDYDLIAVNFFATSPEYVKYRPGKYVLCDPAFWSDSLSEELSPKVSQFYMTIAKVTEWPLELYLPYQAKKCDAIKEIFVNNTLVAIKYYNKTKFEGWGQNAVYRKQWGMPRAQNVLNAALMLAVHSKYKQIYLAGADNDWIRNIWVDEENTVRINDTHFYDYKEMMQHAKNFGMPIDEAVLCFYFAFSTYKRICEFAKRNGVTIINTTPLSYIDVFEKNPQL